MSVLAQSSISAQSSVSSQSTAASSSHITSSSRSSKVNFLGKTANRVQKNDKTSNSLERLVCYYTNATSLRAKISELQLIASNSRPHIISITETWFVESSVDKIMGYTIYRRDRNSQGYG